MNEIERRAKADQLINFMLFGEEARLEKPEGNYEQRLDQASQMIENLALELSDGDQVSAEELMERIGKLRQEIPDIAIRTTLISGFPGETESDHEELMDFVNEMEFERLGVFAYSAEEDTPAFSYPDQVPEEVKEERRDEIMELQQDIAFEHCENMVGRVLTVLIEGKVVDEPAYVGRTYMDAPNVDGLIFVNGDVELMSGDFVRVKVTGAAEYDLIGEVYDESAQ